MSNNNTTNYVDLLGLAPTITKDQGLQSLRESLIKLEQECKDCCPEPDMENCKKEAKTIVDSFVNVWSDNYGKGDQKEDDDNVGGFLCYNWTNRFLNSLKGVKFSSWNIEQQIAISSPALEEYKKQLNAKLQIQRGPRPVRPPVHAWLKVTIKSKRSDTQSKCEGYSYDDGYFGTSCFHSSTPKLPDNWERFRIDPATGKPPVYENPGYPR